MSGHRAGPIAVRGYGLTPWSRGFVDLVEGTKADTADALVADSVRIAKARRYFRDRHVHRLSIGSGRASATVDGSQLEPFDVLLTTRPVDPAAVADQLRTRDAVAELMALGRGEQPPVLGELLSPAASGDITVDCTCPDDVVRCVHALVVAYEVAAEIDRSPLTLLTLAGADIPGLLTAVGDATTATPAADTAPLHPDDHYGTDAVLPPLPSPPRMNPLTELDGTALRAALRATGIAPGDIAEAIDELGDLYDRLTD